MKDLVFLLKILFILYKIKFKCFGIAFKIDIDSLSKNLDYILPKNTSILDVYNFLESIENECNFNCQDENGKLL